MTKRIDECLSILSKISLDNLNYEYISKILISYKGNNSNKSIKSINNIFNDVSDNNKKFVELFDKSILISNVENLDDKHKKIELGIFNKLEFTNENLELIIDYLNKKKIKFKGKLNIYDNVGYLLLNVTDCDDALKIIDYINCKLSKNIYCSNPLFFNMENVMISINEEYSYIEILSMYLQEFILKMNKINNDINYNNFKAFILDNYSKIDTQIDMYQYLKLNIKHIKLSSFFNNLEEMTNLIMYLFNGNNYEEFKDYIRKLNRKNSKQNNKYLLYDNLDDCNILLEELVSSMFLNYGEEYAKDNIIKYKNTGKSDYITRKDNLRKKVMASKTFMIFLQKISLENEIEKLLNKYKLERNKKILEEVCKETYLSYWEENENYGKIQVARGLIRMSYGDYSAITRSNDARKNAIENIDSIDIIRLIKYSLCIDTFVKEEELYELYAEYIERLCTN